MNEIGEISLLKNVSPHGAEKTSGAGNGFEAFLERVNDDLQVADRMAAEFAAGRADLIDAVLAANHADVSFGMLTALRSQALAAYQQIMNMQI